MMSAIMFDTLKAVWTEWAVYYALGYLGVFLHLYFSVPKAIHIHDWIKENTREFVMSLLSYNLLIFAWMDGSLAWIKLTPESPNILTALLAYSGQSIIVHVIEVWESKILPFAKAKLEAMFSKEEPK